MREKLKNQPLRLLTFLYSVEHVQVLQVYKFFSSQKKKKKVAFFPSSFVKCLETPQNFRNWNLNKLRNTVRVLSKMYKHCPCFYQRYVHLIYLTVKRS